MPGQTEPPIIELDNKNEGNELNDVEKQASKVSLQQGSATDAKDVSKETSHISISKEADGKVTSKQSSQINITETTKDKQPSNNDLKNAEQLPPVNNIKDNPAADLRHMRHIIAEDPEWNLRLVPSLVEICLRHIVGNFLNVPNMLNKLQTKHKVKVLEKLPTNLPIQITAPLIEDEGYWKRCCKDKWQVCDVAAFGGCWKRMLFERNLQKLIEQFVPGTTDPAELYDTVKLFSRYVRKLDIRQLLPPIKDPLKILKDDVSDDEEGNEANEGPEMDHFDFSHVLPQLPFLEELHVTYGVRDCGMNFEWKLFQFTARDCLQLAQSVAAYKTLRVLHLHRSKVDDDKVRVLIKHILDHPGIVELDISHNIIGDKGARGIGKLLTCSRLTKLNVGDNCIRAMGGQAIAHALIKNTSLIFLNLELNRLGDEGGQAIFKALLKNETLQELYIATNDFREPTAAVIAQVIIQNVALKVMDLSNNRLGPDGGKQLQEGMEQNQTITQVDLRLTDCGQEAEYCINQILNKNREKERMRLIAAQSRQQSKLNMTTSKKMT